MGFAWGEGVAPPPAQGKMSFEIRRLGRPRAAMARRGVTLPAVLAGAMVFASLPVQAVPRGLVRPRRVGESSGAPVALGGGGAASSLAPAAPVSADGVGRAACRVRRDVLTYHGGEVMMNPQVFLLFWGPEWNNPPAGSDYADAENDLLALYGSLETSNFACAWGEYATAPGATNQGGLAGSYVIPTDPAPLDSNGELDDATIQAEITSLAGTNGVPLPTADTMYVVVTPNNVPVNAGGVTGCGGSNFVFCGYHNSFISGGAYRYAVLPFPCNAGIGTCFFDSTPGLSLEVVGSHELTEAATDPDGDAWYSDRTGNENADICASSPCTIFADTQHAFSLNPGWSNLGNGCVYAAPCQAPSPISCTDPNMPGLCVAGRSVAGACALEWLVYPNLTETGAGLPGRVVTCTDGSPFCDADATTDGKCTFEVAGCLNSSDPRTALACSGSVSVDSVQVTAPSLTSSKPDDQTNAQALLAAFSSIDANTTGTVSGGLIAYAPPATTANSCTSFINISVPLRVIRGRMYRGARRLSLTLHTSSGIFRNQLTLICKP
jgi:hypothetical protein